MNLTEQRENIGHFALEALDEQEDKHYKVADIDSFETWTSVAFQSGTTALKREAARLVLSRPDMGDVSEHRVKFWVDASRIETMLCKLFLRDEGMASCSDKARNVIRAYDAFEASGKMPEPMADEGKRDWWLPQHGTWEQWFTVVKHAMRNDFGAEYAHLILDIYA